MYPILVRFSVTQPHPALPPTHCHSPSKMYFHSVFGQFVKLLSCASASLTNIPAVNGRSGERLVAKSSASEFDIVGDRERLRG